MLLAPSCYYYYYFDWDPKSIFRYTRSPNSDEMCTRLFVRNKASSIGYEYTIIIEFTILSAYRRTLFSLFYVHLRRILSLVAICSRVYITCELFSNSSYAAIIDFILTRESTCSTYTFHACTWTRTWTRSEISNLWDIITMIYDPRWYCCYFHNKSNGPWA